MAFLKTAQVRKFIHRHRRLLGSVSASLAVLFLFVSLRSTPQATATGGVLASLNQGQVAVPVTLRSAAITASVKIGDTIDLIAPTTLGFPEVIAVGAVVIDIPGSGGFSSTNSAVIVVAVDHSAGMELAANISPEISVVVTKR